jgi:tetratricopeptide (TPR) repeat protein
LAFLWKLAREQVTVKRAVLAAVLIPLGLYIYDEAFLNNAIILEPFSVPKRYEEAGFTPEAMGRLVADALLDLEEKANSRLAKDRLALSSDPSSVPDIEVPGTKLGLRTLVEATQQVFRHDTTHIRGSIVSPLTGGPEVANSEVEIILRVAQGRNRGLQVTARGPAGDPHGVAQKTAEAILRQINPYLLGAYRRQTKDWDGAIKIAREVIDNPPKDRRETARAYLLWGLALSDQGKDAEAIPLYQKATTLDPKLAPAYYDWGLVLARQGKSAEAVPLYEKATTLDPKLAPAYNSWGNALANQGKNAEAIPLYQKAIALDPNLALAYNNWGLALADQGKSAEAVPLYEKATTLDPKLAPAYNNWGNALADRGENAEAATLYEKATALDPKLAYAYNNWGLVLAKQGRNAEAVPLFQKATALDPKFGRAFMNWADALDAIGKHAEAEEKRRKAAEGDRSK